MVLLLVGTWSSGSWSFNAYSTRSDFVDVPVGTILVYGGTALRDIGQELD